MSTPKAPKTRETFETEPPTRARCPRCGNTALRSSYSTLYREHGFRRVVRDCKKCNAMVWWDEELEEGEARPPSS